MAHTPRWQYAYEGSGYHGIYTVDQDDNLVAEVIEGEGFNREQAISHGVLIAAAPEMLEMLESVQWRDLANDDRSCPECQREQASGHAPDCALAALLRKARGENA